MEMVNLTDSRCTPAETDAGTHCIGDWVSPISILDAQKRYILFLCWEFNLDSSAMQPVAVPTEL
jgi:hypothetical protein